MASEGSSSTAHPAPEAASDHLSINLQVLSPSTAANSSRPLVFPGLAATTTVKQLKEKIRQALPLKPSDSQQRLIYRGRVLQPDGETLLSVIGEGVIRTTDQQTIHLVLRDVAEPQPSTTPTPSVARGTSPAPPNAHFHQTFGQPHHTHHHGSQPTAAAFTRRTPLHPAANNPLPFVTPSQIPANLTPQQLQQIQAQQHQSMAAWMNGLQREAMNRAMANQQINQNQAMRASMGMHGAGDTAGAAPNPADPTRGRVSPLNNPDVQTYVREGLMPNGQPYRVTVNETFLGGSLNVHQPGGQSTTTALSAFDVQNILRAADSTQATLALTNAMQRSASSTSLANGSSSVGVTTPYYPTLGSRASSRRPTPDPTARSASGGSGHSTNAQRQTQSGPEVYILSSPQGPRAILINNATDSYYTPSARRPAHTTSALQQTASALARMRARPQHMAWPSAFVTPPAHQEGPQPAQQAEAQGPAQPQPEAQPLLQPQGQPPVAAVPVHPNNPGIAPLIAQVWPHFWLVVRLALFVWWFTSPNASWSRWFTVVVIAASIFILNTGLLNNYFDQAVGPVRRHMENLIPLAAPNNANEPVHPPNNQPVVGPNGQPDPTRAAARLVAQRRRNNANWLMDQARRLERAGLLFLASIAPGVAERHIAHLEAEARAERQRQEEAEAAATAAAEAAEAAANRANTETQNNDDTTENAGHNEAGNGNEAQSEPHEGGQRPAEEQQPLLV
ncbi:ubiquitin family protein [Colletotrichum graminicola]|uniref:Ubiquitin family protein n=1 Tax=Colletotrichum graminicola (strain M1.001 / M2 / FGSC 10212) TaxID=645133 RepID=E3Q4T2_COLGM|nr:ubiquitin family protein [Colletotrichum graminicola M1.001]EFQ26097.1 ubiquitin family protein [Colletotrichum graminicola M1.001]WDK23259.1 ubiquitin family protein [Colletotrichum graminicola]